jgi:hypothetical protein
LGRLGDVAEGPRIVINQEQLREARRALGALRAKFQHLATDLARKWGDDWETRYVAQGIADIENDANEENE